MSFNLRIVFCLWSGHMTMSDMLLVVKTTIATILDINRNEQEAEIDHTVSYTTNFESETTLSLGHFCLALCSFGPPSRVLVVITWRGVGCHYMMRLG